MHKDAHGDSRSRPAVPPVEVQAEIAHAGDVPARWNLAVTHGIDPTVAQILSTDQDERILEALASNYSAPSQILAALAAKSDALRTIAAWNPFAPPELKQTVLLREHASLAITRFLEDMNASPHQRELLMQAYNDAVVADDPATTLAEAWSKLTSP